MEPVKLEFLFKDSVSGGIARVSSEVDSVGKDADRSKGAIKGLESELMRLRKLAERAVGIDMGDDIKQIDALQKKLVELQRTSNAVDLSPKDAQAAMRTYNGLNMSIQQIARELPTLAMGPQMFFLAISNNLPIFSDELARARKEYQALTAAGQKGTPVWRQLLSSIFSWQTALAVGIMLSVSYGKEIGKFFSDLFKGKRAFDAARAAAEGFHATMVAGARDAQKESIKLNMLYRAATDNARSMEQRRIAAQKLQESYPDYFKKLSTEQIMLGNASEAYRTLTQDIYAYAKAQAALKGMTDIAAAEQTLRGAPSYERFQKTLARESDAQRDAAQWKRILDDYLKNEDRRAAAAQKSLREAYERLEYSRTERIAAGKDVLTDLSKLPGGDDIVEDIEEKFNNDVKAYIEAMEMQKERLAAVAVDAPTMTDPAEVEKAAKDSASDLERYKDNMRKMEEEAAEQRVQMLEEGFGKERAAIRASYEKKRAEYEAEERKTLALIKKIRRSGGAINADAEKNVMAKTAALIAGAESVRDRDLAQIDKAAYDKLVDDFGTYQQKRLAIAEKYDKEIARLPLNSENRRIAEQAKQKALDDFTVSFANQYPEFEAWANMIMGLTVEKIGEAITEARNQLTMLRELHPFDENAIAKAEAKIIALERRKEALEVKGNVEDKTTDTTKWTDLHNVLKDVIDTFEEVGQVIGGAGGEIVSAAGKTAAASLQIVNSIKAFKTAEEKGDKMGMASGILGGISAGISVITTLVSLFKGGETSLERNLRLAREFNEELVKMRQSARVNDKSFDNIFGDRVYGRFRQNADVAREALERLDQVRGRITSRGEERTGVGFKGNTGLAGLSKVDKDWSSVSESIANMQVQTRHSTWVRSAKYASLGNLLPGLFQDGEVDMAALKKFVEEGDKTFQHLSDENKRMLTEMVEDWELYEEAMEGVRDYLSGLFGDMGNAMTDALVTAAENGTSAFDAMAESAGKALRQLAKDMIYTVVLGPIVEQAQKEMEEVAKSGKSDEEKFKAYTDIISNMITQAADAQNDATAIWKAVKEAAAEKGIDIGDMEGQSQSAKAGAMSAVTQELFGRVEGLVTSIQIHAANIDSQVGGGVVPTLGESLDVINKIEGHCRNLPLVYALLERMWNEGIKMR